MAASLATLTARLAALRRDSIGLRVDMATLLGSQGLPAASDEQIDALMDED